MGKEKILVTVKTYPNLSSKYGETVCTAGIREDGSWVRLYPVTFRCLDQEEQYHKYDWIECEVVKNTTDHRPESFHPINDAPIRRVGHLSATDNWSARRRFLLNKCKIFNSLDEIKAKEFRQKTSLIIFKPTKILDFIWEPEERDWDPQKLKQIHSSQAQGSLLEDNAWRTTFQIIPKLPYKFSYKFEDGAGTTSTLMVSDWETGALYWNCLNSVGGDEAKALEKVRQKYFDGFIKTDLHFFLGTTKQFHFVAPNPWLIVGVLPIPYEQQLGLF